MSKTFLQGGAKKNLGRFRPPGYGLDHCGEFCVESSRAFIKSDLTQKFIHKIVYRQLANA